MSTETVDAPEVETAEAETKPAKAPKVATPCACGAYTGKDAKGETLTTGCTATTVRTFGPGHDAKLKSLLIKTHVAGNQVTKTSDDGSTEEIDPVYAAEEFGFRAQVEKGKATADKKAQAKEDAAKKRADAKEAKAKLAQEAKEKAKADRDAKKAQAEALKAAEDKLNEDKPVGPARAKVGRKDVQGEVLEDGKFRYMDDKGVTVETDKFRLLVDPETVTVDAN